MVSQSNGCYGCISPGIEAPHSELRRLWSRQRKNGDRATAKITDYAHGRCWIPLDLLVLALTVNFWGRQILTFNVVAEILRRLFKSATFIFQNIGKTIYVELRTLCHRKTLKRPIFTRNASFHHCHCVKFCAEWKGGAMWRHDHVT